MHIADSIRTVHNNTEQLRAQFASAEPVPMLVQDNFLDASTAHKLSTESQDLAPNLWTQFTRRGSYMDECKQLEHAPVLRQTVEQLNSSTMLNWLSKVTGIQGLVPDPHLTGAGYSRSYRGDTLQVHNDFNWNEQLRLHRSLSMIIYITPEWEHTWGGSLDFYTQDQTQIVTSVHTLFNRMLLWQYTPWAYHGYAQPIQCPPNQSRRTLRLFYYVSNSTHNPDDPPHRSQYWFDPAQGGAYDRREHP